MKEALSSSKSAFVIVYGRRRVGKTYLIKNVLGNRISFEMTGIQGGDLRDQLKANQSIPQNIDRLCFDANGFLRNEFSRLFKSLFEKAENHIAVVKALASKWKGLTRKEIVAFTGLSNAGSLNRILEELEKSAFIQTYYPFGKKKKGSLYRLTDNFSLFYLKLISQRGLQNQKNVFLKIFTNQNYQVWCGYAFENTCFIHYRQIARALGISSIFHEFSSFQFAGNDTYNGIQVDLLIDRADGVINLCEVKFSNADYKLSPVYKKTLRERANIFSSVTQSRKSVFITLVTTYGLTKPDTHIDVIQNVITLEELFQPA